MSDMSAFKIRVDRSRLDFIRRRVDEFQFPTLPRNTGWSYGVDCAFFQKLLSDWREHFDWGEVERKLNDLPQFIANINGRELHFLRFNGGNGPPLLLLHGWPYSFATMLPLAEQLGKDFEIVIPSLPGFGFSEVISENMVGVRSLSEPLHQLMTEALHHRRYMVHGGDMGAEIADWLAFDKRDSILGFHTHFIYLRHEGAAFASAQTGAYDALPDEIAFVRREASVFRDGGAYFQLQATRPEAVAYALSDSPAGWAAYLLDKWRSWSDLRQQRFEDVFDNHRLLLEIMIYLVSNTITTSMWPYPSYVSEPGVLRQNEIIDTPFGHSAFPDPLIPKAPLCFAQRSRSDIRFWRDHDAGGHFPMLEATKALADDITAFAQTVA